LLENGGFETGSLLPGWSSEGDVAMGAGRESDYGVHLGGRDEAYGQLSQTRLIPSGSDPVRLEFWWRTETEVEQLTDGVQVWVSDSQGPNEMLVLRAINPIGVWRHEAVDLTSFAGENSNLSFVVSTDHQHPSVFILDDVSLKACGVPSATPTASATASAVASPGTSTATAGTPVLPSPSASNTMQPTPPPSATATATPPGTPAVRPQAYLPIGLNQYAAD
jgi:hypothetical protein